MAWIERRGDRFYILDRKNGKLICVAVGTNETVARSLRDRINKRKARAAKVAAAKKLDDLYPGGSK